MGLSFVMLDWQCIREEEGEECGFHTVLICLGSALKILKDQVWRDDGAMEKEEVP